MGVLHLGQKLLVHRISKLKVIYVMPAMDMFHKPVNMKKMMSGIKPGIKNEEIDKDLLNGFKKSKLIFTSLPISIIWC